MSSNGTTTLKGYELAGEWAALDELLLESAGEITPEIHELLEQLEQTTTEKIEKIGLVAQRYANEAKAIAMELERLQARKRTYESSSAKLKLYAGAILDRLGTPSVKGVLCSVGWQNNPESIEGELTTEQLRELATIAPQIVRIIPEQFVLDKRGALEWHTQGNALPDGLTVTRGRHVRIR